MDSPKLLVVKLTMEGWFRLTERVNLRLSCIHPQAKCRSRMLNEVRVKYTTQCSTNEVVETLITMVAVQFRRKIEKKRENRMLGTAADAKNSESGGWVTLGYARSRSIAGTTVRQLGSNRTPRRIDSTRNQYSVPCLTCGGLRVDALDGNLQMLKLFQHSNFQKMVDIHLEEWNCSSLVTPWRMISFV